MRLTLVRHAESTWNSSGRWQGQTDVPLSPRGRLQVRALATRLYEQAFDRCVSSDLSRAAETATAIALPAELDRHFREIDVGKWAGLARSEVAIRFPDEVEGLRAGRPVRIGGGESMTEFEARVDGAIDALLARAPGERVALVTHGGVIRAHVTRVLAARHRVSPLVGVGNASLTRVAFEAGRAVLEVYNDDAHLGMLDPDSAVTLSPEPMTLAALICADPARSSERREADSLLSSVGIAQIGSVGAANDLPLATQLLAEPHAATPREAFENLCRMHEDGAFALVLTPHDVRALIGEVLALPPEGVAGLALPAHGSLAYLRRTAKGTLLDRYGVVPS